MQLSRWRVLLSSIFALLLFLCRLYRSLGDYDVLRGIFTGHIGTKPITQDALEAEARGDFSQALKLYNEVTVFPESSLAWEKLSIAWYVVVGVLTSFKC